MLQVQRANHPTSEDWFAHSTQVYSWEICQYTRPNALAAKGTEFLLDTNFSTMKYIDNLDKFRMIGS